MAHWSATWQVVIEAGALNCELVPADALHFCDFYALRRTSLRECLTVAFVKEPQATTMFAEECCKLGACPSKEELRTAWMRVIKRVVECGQDKEALRNLTRQGAGRFTCLARVMTKIGLIECAHPMPSTAAGEVFTLGLDNRKYRFCTGPSESKFDDFFEALQESNAQWRQLLRMRDGLQLDLFQFGQKLRSVLQFAANAHSAFGIKSNGHCYDFAYRKFIIAETCRRNGQFNWEASMGEIRERFATTSDNKRFARDLREGSARCGARIHAVYGRTDFAIMLSIFACLWSEVVTKRVDTGEMSLADLLHLLRSGKLSSIVAEYKQAHGYAPHPLTLMEIYDRTCRGVGDLGLKRKSVGKQVKFTKSKKQRPMEPSD